MIQKSWYVPGTHGQLALDAIESLGSGECILLETVRMTDDELPERPPEEHARSELVETLASEFDGEVTMVAGGKKATDVIDVMSSRAIGYDVGRNSEVSDLYESQWHANKDRIRSLIESHPSNFVYPSDLADAGSDGERAEVTVSDVRNKEHNYLDIGHDTIDQFSDIAATSSAVFVKGALGVFEDERFSPGTIGLLEANAERNCFSVVGGGDTSRAIDTYGVDEGDFSHVSIGGGAYIDALAGRSLPGVETLRHGVETTQWLLSYCRLYFFA